MTKASVRFASGYRGEVLECHCGEHTYLFDVWREGGTFTVFLTCGKDRSIHDYNLKKKEAAEILPAIEGFLGRMKRFDFFGPRMTVVFREEALPVSEHRCEPCEKKGNLKPT